MTAQVRIGSLFSGAGMLDEGVRAVVGGEVAWHAEHEPPTKQNPKPRQAAARVLAHRYPGVPNLGDVSTVDWATVERVDVLTGGFPCQDVSPAGKRAGMRAGTRSGLWARMCDAIDALRPSLVVIENVRGLVSAEADSALEFCAGCVGDGDDGPVLRALGRVLGDLADVGYDAQWRGLRAADVGAPHGRFRVFIVAHPSGEPWGLEHAAGLGVTPDAAHLGHERSWRARVGRLGSADGGAGALDVDWGPYEPAIRRWERLTGRAPLPWETGARGGRRLAPRFVEWMLGWPAGWVTEVPGISRNDQLKICGNGVVPQQAAAAVGSLLAHLAEQAA